MIFILFDKEQLKRMKLYNEGYSDRQISNELNIPITAVKVWRNIYKLKENKMEGDNFGNCKN